MRNGTFFRPHRSSTENMRLFRCSLAITRTTQVGVYFIIYTWRFSRTKLRLGRFRSFGAFEL